jgi:hypothetical protein
MCLNCGCGEPEKRHHPTDITRKDVQQAADGGEMSFEEAASNVQASLAKIGVGDPDRAGTPVRPT